MKDAHLRVLEAWLDQWSARLNESQARLDAVTDASAALDAEARANHAAHRLALQEKIDLARAKLQEGRLQVDALRATDAAWSEVQAGTESAWEVFKTGAEAAWEDLKQLLDQTAAKPEPPADRNAPATGEPAKETNDTSKH
jgi:hypothetical protein